MAFCKKCGAYIPIGDTACPACGYDPEEEERQAKEQREREEAQARREKEAEEAAEKARKEKERREQQQKARAEQERKRAEEQRKKWNQSGSATQSQYASQQTDKTEDREERTGWTPPWQESQNSSSYYAAYAKNKARAADSAANQHLSVLSYFGPLFLIPLFARPNDDFARFHVGQGLNLFLFNALLTLLGNSSGLIPLAGSVFSIYCMIKGIRNVLKGKREPLPLIGKLRIFR